MNTVTLKILIKYDIISVFSLSVIHTKTYAWKSQIVYISDALLLGISMTHWFTKWFSFSAYIESVKYDIYVDHSTTNSKGLCISGTMAHRQHPLYFICETYINGNMIQIDISGEVVLHVCEITIKAIKTGV